MTWARIENNEIINTVDQPNSSMPIWVEEEYEDDKGKTKKHIVKTSVSLPQNWEVDSNQMQEWGWTEVEELNKEEGFIPGEVQLIDGKPIRDWTEPPPPPEPVEPAPPPSLDDIASGGVADMLAAMKTMAEEIRALKGEA